MEISWKRNNFFPWQHKQRKRPVSSGHRSFFCASASPIKKRKPKFSVAFVAFVVFRLQSFIYQLDMFFIILLFFVVFVVIEEEKTTLNNTKQHLNFNTLYWISISCNKSNANNNIFQFRCKKSGFSGQNDPFFALRSKILENIKYLIFVNYWKIMS